MKNETFKDLLEIAGLISGIVCTIAFLFTRDAFFGISAILLWLQTHSSNNK